MQVAAFARLSGAQERFFSSWEGRVRATIADQPAWPVPVVTPSSGLVQLFRTDLVRQITAAETTTRNYGNTKVRGELVLGGALSNPVDSAVLTTLG
jgi:hypothetical protein